MTLNFACTLFLLLSASKDIPQNVVKRYVQKWYILSSLTGRYVASPESAMDRDIRSIEEKGFVQFFQENEEAVLSDTFWKIGLVQAFETSAINSPYFNAFIAAQIHANDRALFSNSIKVSDLISIAARTYALLL